MSRFVIRSTIFGAAFLVLGFALQGCDVVKSVTEDKAAVQADEEAKADELLDKQVTETPVAPDIEPMDPIGTITRFKDLAPEHRTDTSLKLLSEMKSDRDLIDVVDLSNANITRAGLESLAKLPNLQTLILFGSTLRGKDFEPLAALTTLTTLSVERSPGFNNLSVPAVAKLVNLRTLNMSETGISDSVFGELTSLKALRTIHINKTKVNGSGFGHFKKARIGLEQIFAGGSMFGQYGLVETAGSTTLIELDASGSGVTDTGLKQLQKCRNLENLAVGFNDKVTDAGLTSVGKLKKLKKLNLKDCKSVTGIGLRQIRNLKKLYELDLDNTGCTDADVKALKERLPDVAIRFNGTVQ